VSILTGELGPKRLTLVRALLPKPGTIAFVVNKNSAMTPFQVQEMETAAQGAGQQLVVVSVGTEEEVDNAFAMMAGFYGAKPWRPRLSGAPGNDCAD